MPEESTCAARLLDAQTKAAELFAEIESRGLAAPGAGERHPLLRRTDKAGRRWHWILEIHLVDRVRGFGGFYEELLDLG